MSVLFEKRDANLAGFVTSSVGSMFNRAPRKKSHLAHSAAWACVDLRAGLISSLPVDTFRNSPTGQMEMPTPQVLVEPGGSEVAIGEWMYSTQSDLDTHGNAFGKITKRTDSGLPARIDLVAREDVRVQCVKGVVSYYFQGKKVDRELVWHERQYTASGMVVGLSPVAYAAMSLLQHSAAQDFASAWFGGGLIPTAHLKYGAEKVPPKDAETIKERFKLAIENGDPFVTGKDWEYNPIDAAAAQATFIEAMGFTDIQIARFFRVPGDLIDVATEGSSITYANITQRNLQFLVMNLGPAIKRREDALSRLLPSPRFVKLNSDALLRMDPETTSNMLGQQVRDRLRAPAEARGKLNLHPFTPEQIDEFKELFPQQYPEKPATAAREITIGETS